MPTWNPNNNKWRHMASLPKQWQIRTSAKPTKLDRKALINVLFIEFEQLWQNYANFWQIWLFCAMPTYKIWSFHMTLDRNFENCIFCPNSTFNIRKRLHVFSGKALYFRRYQPKILRGWKTQICRMVEFLIDNIFLKFGGCLFVRSLGFQWERIVPPC